MTPVVRIIGEIDHLVSAERVPNGAYAGKPEASIAVGCGRRTGSPISRHIWAIERSAEIAVAMSLRRRSSREASIKRGCPCLLRPTEITFLAHPWASSFDRKSRDRAMPSSSAIRPKTRAQFHPPDPGRTPNGLARRDGASEPPMAYGSLVSGHPITSSTGRDQPSRPRGGGPIRSQGEVRAFLPSQRRRVRETEVSFPSTSGVGMCEGGGASVLGSPPNPARCR